MTLQEAYDWRPTLCDCKNPYGPKCDCGQRQKNVDTLHQIEDIIRTDNSYVSDTEWLKVFGYSDEDMMKIYSGIGVGRSL